MKFCMNLLHADLMLLGRLEMNRAPIRWCSSVLNIAPRVLKVRLNSEPRIGRYNKLPGIICVRFSNQDTTRDQISLTRRQNFPHVDKPRGDSSRFSIVAVEAE